MVTTLVAMPIWAKIGRTSPAERPPSAVAVCGRVRTAVRGGVGGRSVSIGETYKLADSWRYQDRSGVMLTTLATQPIRAKIGYTRAGPGGGSGLLQYVGMLRRQSAVVWKDDACLSERYSSLQVVGATSTQVASC